MLIGLRIGQTGISVNDNTGFKDQHYLISRERYAKKLQCTVLNETIMPHQVSWKYNKG